MTLAALLDDLPLFRAAAPAPAPAPPDAMREALEARLRALGLTSRIREVRTHRNRTVMVSVTRGGVLRVHAGYAQAPDRILSAIVTFVAPFARRASRRAAQAELVRWADEAGREAGRWDGADGAWAEPPARAPRVREEDAPTVARLTAAWADLNARHFGGALRPVPIVLSSRMRRRLGQLDYDRHTGAPTRITLSRRMLRRHGWTLTLETLLHEMVHQWQAETGRPVDHGADFRRKAREVGIEARATVDLARR